MTLRLRPDQINAVRQITAALAGPNAAIRVFGSRLLPDRQGGDLDLLIETDEPFPLLEQARLKVRLEQRLELPVDLVVHQRGTSATPFQQIALARSRPL